MTAPSPRPVPIIFSPARTAARLARAARRASRPDAARFLAEDVAEDLIERLAFVRAAPSRALVLGDWSGAISTALCGRGVKTEADMTAVLTQPLPVSGFDFIAVIGLLDAVNDLPGALIHLRHALTPGGLVIASFIGGQSLPSLRAAMLAAEADRPAARFHPLVDHRAAPQLLQRAGWKDPVVDTRQLIVRYTAIDRLIGDLRDSGLGNALARSGPPLARSALARARAAFAERADADGKVAEVFEIITLTGRRSLAGT